MSNNFLDSRSSGHVDLESGNTPAYLSSLRIKNIDKSLPVSVDANGFIFSKKLDPGDLDLDLSGLEKISYTSGTNTTKIDSKLDLEEMKDVKNEINTLQTKTTGQTFNAGTTTIDNNLQIGTAGGFYKNLTCNTIYATEVQANKILYADLGDDKNIETKFNNIEDKIQNISYDSISESTQIEEPLIVQGNGDAITRFENDLIAIENPIGSLRTTLKPALISLGSGAGGNLYVNSSSNPAGYEEKGIYQRGFTNNGVLIVGGSGSGGGTGQVIIGGSANKGSLEVKGEITGEELTINGDSVITGNLELGNISNVEQEIDNVKAKTANITNDGTTTEITNTLKVGLIDDVEQSILNNVSPVKTYSVGGLILYNQSSSSNNVLNTEYLNFYLAYDGGGKLQLKYYVNGAYTNYYTNNYDDGVKPQYKATDWIIENSIYRPYYNQDGNVNEHYLGTARYGFNGMWDHVGDGTLGDPFVAKTLTATTDHFSLGKAYYYNQRGINTDQRVTFGQHTIALNVKDIEDRFFDDCYDYYMLDITTISGRAPDVGDSGTGSNLVIHYTMKCIVVKAR